MIAICFSGLDDCDVTRALDEHSSPPKNKKICFNESGFFISNMNIARTSMYHVVLLIGIYWPNTEFLSCNITGFDSQIGEGVPMHIIRPGLGQKVYPLVNPALVSLQSRTNVQQLNKLYHYDISNGDMISI